MTPLFRLMAVFAILVGSAGWVSVGVMVTPAGAWQWPELSAFTVFADEARRAEDLRARGRVVLDRLARRTDVVKAVIDGRMPLAEAGAVFRRLTQEREPLPGGIPPTVTDAAVWCGEVLRFARAAMTSTPDRQAEVMDRLETELAAVASADGRDAPDR